MKCGFDLDTFMCVTFTTSCDFCLLEGTQFHSFTKILVSELDLLSMFPCSVCTWLFRIRSLLCSVYNCKHRKVVTLAVLISTKAVTLFQIRL